MDKDKVLEPTKYRKKPIVVEAVHYAGKGNITPDNKGIVPNWIWAAFESGVMCSTNGGDPLIIKTLEGDHTVSPDDWIIQGVKGELYACKPDIFEMTYELAAIEAESSKELAAAQAEIESLRSKCALSTDAIILVENLLGEAGFYPESSARHNLEIARSLLHDIIFPPSSSSTQALDQAIAQAQIASLRTGLEDIASGELGVNLCVKQAKKLLDVLAIDEAIRARGEK